MGLGKKTGSTRINRYEQQASAIGLTGLTALAKTLEVPLAYLLAESPEMADAILAVAQVDQAQQAGIVEILKKASTDPALLEQLRALAEPKDEP